MDFEGDSEFRWSSVVIFLILASTEFSIVARCWRSVVVVLFWRQFGGGIFSRNLFSWNF